MPTPGGLPKVGEIWERVSKLPPKWDQQVIRFAVMERGRGDYWPLRVYIPGHGIQLWVDASYWHSRGQLKFIGEAGPETKKKLGLV